MHYKDGTPAKLGDVVKGPGHSGGTLIGVVAQKYQGTTCNLSVLPLALVMETDGERQVTPLSSTAGTPWSLTAGDCEKVA